MGFTPLEVDQMSFWQFAAASHGYAKAHGGESPSRADPMNEDRMRELGIITDG